MKTNIAQAIVEKAAELGVNALLREGYSGRGMYGKTTTGIVVDGPSDIMEICTTIIAGIDSDELVKDFIKQFRTFRLDNMGMSYIYY